MTDRIFARINQDRVDQPSQDSFSLTTPQRVVTWSDSAGPVNITGGSPEAFAARADRTERLTATILNAAAGEVLVTWPAGTLTAGQWTIEHRLTLSGVTSGVRWLENVVESYFMPPSGVPVVTADGTITQAGSETVTLTFTDPTATGTEPITTTLAATLDGLPLTVTGGTATVARTASAQAVAATWTLANDDGEATSTANLTVAAYTVPAAMAAPVPEVLSASAVRFPRPAAPANGGNAITEYRLYYSVDDVAQAALLDVGATVDVTALDPGSVVVGEFRAVNGAGESAPGATATATTWELPDQMNALTITGGVSLVEIAATSPAALNGRPLATNGYRYTVYDSGGAVLAQVNRPDTSAFTVEGVTPGSGVYVTVSAATDAGRGIESAVSNAVTVLTGASATIENTFPDAHLFDSGFFRVGGDANAGQVPVAGTTDAADGEAIQGRWVAYNEVTNLPTGAVGDWQSLDTASGGAWSGVLTAPRNIYTYYRYEARVLGSAASPALSARSFLVGHKWSLWGQSNTIRAFGTYNSEQTVPAPVVDPLAVRTYQIDRTTSTPFIAMVDDDTAGVGAAPVRAPLVRIANLLAEARPGERFAFAYHTQSGANANTIQNDADTSRRWTDEVILHDAFTNDGTDEVGVVIEFAWGETTIAKMLGKLSDGSAITPGAADPDGGFAVFHPLSEIYDYSYTRFAKLVGGVDPTEAAYWGQLQNPALFPEALPDPQWNYGASFGATSHVETTVPESTYGSMLLADRVAVSLLIRTGLSTAFGAPEVTDADYTSTTHVDIWGAFDITNEETIRSEGSGAIRGVFFNGVETSDVAFLPNAGGSGRQGIRVTPPGGVTASDLVTMISDGDYKGSLSSGTSAAEDRELARRLPVMLTGPAWAPAMPIAPRPDLPNNLPQPEFFTRPSVATTLVAPDGSQSEVQGITFYGRVRLQGSGGDMVLQRGRGGWDVFAGGGMDVTRQAEGGNFLTGWDGGGITNLAQNGLWVDLVYSESLIDEVARIWRTFDGTTIYLEQAFSKSVTSYDGGREFQILGLADMDVQEARFWRAPIPGTGNEDVTAALTALGTPDTTFLPDGSGGITQTGAWTPWT